MLHVTRRRKPVRHVVGAQSRALNSSAECLRLSRRGSDYVGLAKMWIVFDFAAVPKEQRYHIDCIRQRCRTWPRRKVIIDEDCLPLVTVTIKPSPRGLRSPIGFSRRLSGASKIPSTPGVTAFSNPLWLGNSSRNRVEDADDLCLPRLSLIVAIVMDAALVTAHPTIAIAIGVSIALVMGIAIYERRRGIEDQVEISQRKSSSASALSRNKPRSDRYEWHHAHRQYAEHYLQKCLFR